jgi:hypothetical protein
MIRSLLLLLLLLVLALAPAPLGAQQAFVGVQVGRNSAQIAGDRTRSGPAVGVFGQVDLSEHVGVGSHVTWLRSAVEDEVEPWNSAPSAVAEPEYLVTDLVGRLSWRGGAITPMDLTLGATVSGGGWLGVRTGGSFVADAPRRADFGHVWGVSLFAIQGRVKVALSVRAYHGEREVWEGGPRQRGSPAFLAVGYRIR